MPDPSHFLKIIIGDMAFQIAHLQAQMSENKEEKTVPNWSHTPPAEDPVATAAAAELAIRELNWAAMKAQHAAGTLGTAAWDALLADPAFVAWLALNP